MRGSVFWTCLLTAVPACMLAPTLAMADVFTFSISGVHTSQNPTSIAGTVTGTLVLNEGTGAASQVTITSYPSVMDSFAQPTITLTSFVENQFTVSGGIVTAGKLYASLFTGFGTNDYAAELWINDALGTGTNQFDIGPWWDPRTSGYAIVGNTGLAAAHLTRVSTPEPGSILVLMTMLAGAVGAKKLSLV